MIVGLDVKHQEITCLPMRYEGWSKGAKKEGMGNKCKNKHDKKHHWSYKAEHLSSEVSCETIPTS